MGWVVFPGRVPPRRNVAAGSPRGAGALRADVPGTQRHRDPGQLQWEAGPGLCVPARALPQPGGPLRACGSLRVLAPWAPPPGEPPRPSVRPPFLAQGSGPLVCPWLIPLYPDPQPAAGTLGPSLAPRDPPPSQNPCCRRWSQATALAGPPGGLGVGGLGNRKVCGREGGVESRFCPLLPSLDLSGRRPVRAAAVSAGRVSAPSTAPRSPVPRYPSEPCGPGLLPGSLPEGWSRGLKQAVWGAGPSS